MDQSVYMRNECRANYQTEAYTHRCLKNVIIIVLTFFYHLQYNPSADRFMVFIFSCINTSLETQLCLEFSHTSQLFPYLAILNQVLWFYGSMVLWFYGSMVLWFYGSMVSWFYGSMVLWFYGSMVSWFCGSMVLWFHGSMVLWFYRSMVLWFYRVLQSECEAKRSRVHKLCSAIC